MILKKDSAVGKNTSDKSANLSGPDNFFLFCDCVDGSFVKGALEHFKVLH